MDTKPVENITYDKYNDSFFIEKYVALWAYGYVNGIQSSEKLYQKVIELGQSYLDRDSIFEILDIGCGVGRTTTDYARRFPKAHVLGIDKSEMMINYAKKIALSSDCLHLDMRKIGFPEFKLTGFGLSNVDFENISLEEFYGKTTKSKFDLITSVNFIDRVDDVEKSFKIVFEMLKNGGCYIFTSPLNFSNPKDWQKYGSAVLITKLVESIGFRVDVCIDNVLYREILDSRGAAEEYPTLVMRLIKP